MSKIQVKDPNTRIKSHLGEEGEPLCIEALGGANITCAVCNYPFMDFEPQPLAVDLWDSPHYGSQTILHNDCIYLFCSLECGQLFKLNPLAYE